MRIVAVHLLNDFSGSPKVLKQLLKGWVHNNMDVHLFTSAKKEGFLSTISGVNYSYFWYKLAINPYLRLIFLVYSQIVLFLKVLFFLKKNDILYINTVLPFGAALAGKVRGVRVIYHIHETSMKPPILKRFLFGIVQLTAQDVVYVSQYVMKVENINVKNKYLLYNALEEDYFNTAANYNKLVSKKRNVLMICSLKIYKGVLEFVTLAQLNNHLKFRLVVNASQQEIDDFFKNVTLSNNLEIFPVQKDTHPFYQWADLVLNLSHPDLWVETFGLTAIEAMAYKRPVIVPPVGGIAELVEDGVNGFKINPHDTKELSLKINQIFDDPLLYFDLKNNAYAKALEFTENNFVNSSLGIIKRK